MRILIIAFGSRGDVQPYIPMGMALQQAGYQVTVLAGDEFEEFVTGFGLGFYPLGFNIRETASESEVLQEILEGKRNFLLGLLELVKQIRPAVDQMICSMWEASQQADAVVFSTFGLGGYHAAEALGIPAIWTLTMPAFTRTRSIPSPMFPLLPFRTGGVNWLTHILAEQAWQQILGRAYNRWRKKEMGLPPMPFLSWPYEELHGKPVPKIYMHSSAVCPPPPDWGAENQVSGYLFLDQETGWQPPDDLLTFLDAGKPPVYLGFGSVGDRDPAGTTEILLEAIEKSGQRGLLLSGWGGLGNQDLPAHVFKIDSAPHAWLFPQMAAVVHHGGAGTTGAGLRAGVPSIIIPFGGDQSFWGWQVHRLGVGPQPILRKKLTAENLAAAIVQAVSDEDIQQRAAEVGEQIRAEDGTARAVEIIERILKG